MNNVLSYTLPKKNTPRFIILQPNDLRACGRRAHQDNVWCHNTTAFTRRNRTNKQLSVTRCNHFSLQSDADEPVASYDCPPRAAAPLPPLPPFLLPHIFPRCCGEAKDNAFRHVTQWNPQWVGLFLHIDHCRVTRSFDPALLKKSAIKESFSSVPPLSLSLSPLSSFFCSRSKRPQQTSLHTHCHSAEKEVSLSRR